MTAAVPFWFSHFQNFFQSQSECIYKAKPHLRHPWGDQNVDAHADAGTSTNQKFIQWILSHFTRRDNQLKTLDARFWFTHVLGTKWSAGRRLETRDFQSKSREMMHFYPIYGQHGFKNLNFSNWAALWLHQKSFVEQWWCFKGRGFCYIHVYIYKTPSNRKNGQT